MGNINNIIHEYEKGDSGKRLFLFLEHPPLRKVFITIDQSEMPKMGKNKGGWFGLGSVFNQFTSDILNH